MNLLFPFFSKEQIHGQLQQRNTVEPVKVSTAAADNVCHLLLELWAAHASLLLFGPKQEEVRLASECRGRLKYPMQTAQQSMVHHCS